jgi:hypothetical protein
MEKMSFADTFRTLQTEAGRYPQPSPEPSRLPLGALRVAEPLFQPRDIEAAFLATDSHVKVLIDAVKENGEKAFEPLTVWWSGAGWYVIDGHHRLMAFRQHKGIEAVPVTAFVGSINDAIRQSVALNSRDKLPMRKEDKLERAWKLVCLDGGLTKGDIHSATTISERTVTTMRHKRKDLIARGEEPLDWLWREAKNDERQINPDDNWAEEMAQDWARRFGKTFDKKLIEQPAIAARALELYSERLPLELVRFWPDAAQQVIDEEAEAEF